VKKLGPTQSPSLLDRVASAFAQFRRDGYVAAQWRLRAAATSNSLPPPPFQIWLRRAARRMAQVSKPNPYAPWASASGREGGGEV
jgi:hypothetical protein